MPHRTARERAVDALPFALATAVLLLGAVLGDFNLRQWSTLVGLIALIGLLWRSIGTLGRMPYVGRAVTTLLGLNLAAGTLAQYLLAREIHVMEGPTHGPPTPGPDNTVGVVAVLVTRALTILVVLVWPMLERAWDERGSMGA